VRTDGRFDEWREAPVTVDDPGDASPGSPVDFGALRLLDDPQYVHLALDVGATVNAQSMPGTISLPFDADGDPATGGTLGDMDGVDLILELSRRDRPRPGGYGAGVGIRWVDSAGPGPVESAYPADVVVAPTFAAPRFEIRLHRGPVPGHRSIFTGTTLRVRAVVEGSSGGSDRTDIATYRFRTSRASTRARNEGVPVDLRRAAGAFRVVQWNVSDESFRENPELYNRILAVLEPDVILLDEVYGTVTADDLATFFRTAPLGLLGDWRFVLGFSGGRQRGVVATRGGAIRPESTLLDVHYPPGAVDRLEVELSPGSDFGATLELERERGLPTAGAWLDPDGKGADILFVPLDFQSGGYDGSPEDRLRELQAQTLADRLSRVVAVRGPVPIVVAGDLNLVGSRRPLDLLRAAGLAVAEGYDLWNRTQTTWRNPASAFTPGRLDFALYVPRFLRVARAFPFEPLGLGPDPVRTLGVEARALQTSDHVPVVTDLVRR